MSNQPNNDIPGDTPDAVERAAKILLKSKRLVILTGAGVSRESGIPTYREPQTGLWAQYDPMDLATPDGFQRNPKLVWDWNEYRRKEMLRVNPNPGHYAIAELEDLLPSVTVVTQNIDRLHQRAGSSLVIELHGTVHQQKCSANCQGDPTYVVLESLTYPPDTVPTCPHCGAYIRPAVIWFNERLMPEVLESAFEAADTCDVLLTVGTSGVVQPAATIPYRAKRYSDAQLIEVNPTPSEITPYADVYIPQPSGEALPKVIQAMRSLRSE